MKNTVGVLVCIVLLLLASCEGQVSPAMVMTLAPTEIVAPPTSSPMPSTATTVPTKATPMAPTATPIPPTATPTPTLEPTAAPFEGIVVTNKGSRCSVSDSTGLPISELPVGEHQFVVENLTHERVALQVNHLLCGHTFEDLVEIQGVQGRQLSGAEPVREWMLFPEYSMERDQSTGEFIYTYDLDEVGEYGVTLWNHNARSISACGPLNVSEGPSPLPPTATPELTTCEEVEGVCLELTFHGESCTYAGPTEFQQGEVTVLFINASEDHAAVNLMQHQQDKTIQNMLDRFVGGVSTLHAPPWVRSLGTWAPVKPGQNLVWRGTLQPRIHTLVCARFCPWLVWFGAGLTVEE